MPIDPSLSSAFDQYNQLSDKYSSQLDQSPTAMTAGVDPTAADVSLQRQQLAASSAANTARSNQLKAEWYPPATPDATVDTSNANEGDASTNWFGKITKNLMAPTSALVGLTQSALGKGIKPNVWENVKANVAAGSSFGDILRSYGLPNYISAPVGLGLDVVTDPVIGLSEGTASLIPRIGAGIAKGFAKEGVEGALRGGILGAKSGALQAGENVIRTGRGANELIGSIFRPKTVDTIESLAKDAATAVRAAKPAIVDTGMQSNDFIKNWLQWSDDASQAYRDLTKTGPEYYAQQSTRLGKAYDSIMGKYASDPESTLAKVDKFFGYHPDGYLKSVAQQSLLAGDDVQKAIEASFHAALSTGEVPDSLEKELAKSLQAAKNDPGTLSNSALVQGGRLATEMGDTERMSQPVLNAMEEVRAMIVDDPKSLKFWEDLKPLATDDVKLRTVKIQTRNNILQVAKTMTIGSEGTFFNDYDKWVVNTLVKHPTLTKTLKAYESLIGVFKSYAIGTSPAAYVTAFLSNNIMSAMHGIDIADPYFIKAIKEAASITAFPDEAKALAFFNNPNWAKLAEKNPVYFDMVSRSVFNVKPNFVLHPQETLDLLKDKILAKYGIETGVSPEAWQEGVQAYAEKLHTKIGKFAGKASSEEENRLLQAASGEYRSTVSKSLRPSVMGDTSDLAAGVTSPVSRESTTMWNDFAPGVMSGMMKDLEADAKAGGIKGTIANAFLWSIKEPMSYYSQVDKIHRLAMAKYMMDYGFPEKTANILTRFFKPEAASDLVKMPGRNAYTTSLEYATRVANESFLNYSALPPAARMLRSIPLLGAPFASFQYGMLGNTMRTAVNNPGVFDYVNFVMREISGQKSPLEKEALKDPYNSYLNDNGMLKIPLFGDNNVVYANVGQSIPYLTMSLLARPKRTNGQKYGDKIANVIDQLPTFKDPVASWALDWLIMPQLLQEAVGSYGQPLYPAGASTAQKVGMGAASLVGTMVPKGANLLGLIPGLPVPDEALNYVPYLAAKLQRAERGQTSKGIPSKQNATERTVLDMPGAFAGVPFYKVETQYAKPPANQDNQQ